MNPDDVWIAVGPGTVGIDPEDAGPVQPGEPPQQDGRSDLLPQHNGMPTRDEAQRLTNPDPYDDSTTDPRI